MLTEIYKNTSKTFRCNRGGIVRVEENCGGLYWWIEDKTERYGGHYNGCVGIFPMTMELEWSFYKYITEY